MLDERDRRIIAELKKNSRSTIRNIAKKTRLRPSTVHMRIKWLEKNKVIEKYTIGLNRKSVGRDLVAFVLIQTEGRLPLSIIDNLHIEEAYGITGEYDLLLKMSFGGIEDFNRFLLRLREVDAVEKTLSMVATLCLKESSY
ncbi:MAG: Lrp/AsnC family transcriptional regulator [Candidatus Woesearchaeota archaeon]